MQIGIPLDQMTDEQRQRVAAGLNGILKELGLKAEEISGWWNTIAFEQLDNRTPTKAWLDGDYQKVRDFIENMVSASVAAQKRFIANPSIEALIRQRRQTS